MKEDDYLPCPFCGKKPERVEEVDGAGEIDEYGKSKATTDDELIFMVSCANEKCEIYDILLSDTEWNLLAKSKEIMRDGLEAKGHKGRDDNYK